MCRRARKSIRGSAQLGIEIDEKQFDRLILVD